MGTRVFTPLLPLLVVLAGCGFGPSEKGDLPQECSVTNATLAVARTPTDLAMERAGQALLYQTPANHYALLEMPGCRVTPLSDVPDRVGLGDIFIVPGGTRLMAVMPQGRSVSEWWYARGVDSAPVRLAFDAPPMGLGLISPVLSSDGEWIGWFLPRVDKELIGVQVVLRRTTGGERQIVSLAGLGLNLYELLEIDVQAQELTLVRGLNEFIRLGFDGSVRWRVMPGEIVAQPMTYRHLGEGYFVWHAIRDSGPYQIAWALPSDTKTFAFERLRQIQHAAVDPSGRYAAASLETQYGRLLSLRDAISVIRLSDRREIFRKYLPRFNRSQVAFLTARYVAYADGNQVRVLRLPE